MQKEGVMNKGVELNGNRSASASIVAVIAFLILVVSSANSQDLIPGDTVQLEERDLHIPAHPAPNWVDRSSFPHITYRQADKDDWDKISDHCPVAVELWVQ
jgi:hypothetical protein